MASALPLLLVGAAALLLMGRKNGASNGSGVAASSGNKALDALRNPDQFFPGDQFLPAELVPGTEKAGVSKQGRDWAYQRREGERQDSDGSMHPAGWQFAWTTEPGGAEVEFGSSVPSDVSPRQVRKRMYEMLASVGDNFA